MLNIVRNSSSHARLWVKYNGSQAFIVSTAGCRVISEFTEVIRLKLPKQLAAFDSNELTIHKTLTDAALSPGLSIADLSKYVDPNTVESPLFVKIQESITFAQKATDTIAQKSIFIQDIDDECRPIDSFSMFVVESNDDLIRIFEGKGSALSQLSNPKDKITKFKQLIEGERYRVTSRYEKSVVGEERWQQTEDKAMEQETCLTMKRFLAIHLGSSVVDMPTDILGPDKATIVQEWDAIFKVGDILYLCEAKHNMSFNQVTKMPERIQRFKELKSMAQPEFKNIKKCVGVLCGTLFPENVKKNAHQRGFLCVYPSGDRYEVQAPQKEVIIEL